MRQILIIGSSFDNCKILKYALQDDSTKAYYTISLKEGIRHLVRYQYQLILLDISSPDNHFTYSVGQLRKARHSPILVLSSSGCSEHIEQILAVADDFLQKPYDIKVCKAKINALIRHFAYADHQDAPGILSKDGTLMIDTQCRKVYVLDIELTLPRKQFDLLYLMASNEGRVFTREQLQQAVWGDNFIGGENTLNNQIGELRSKLKSVSSAPDYIRTVYGVGYCFDTNLS